MSSKLVAGLTAVSIVLGSIVSCERQTRDANANPESQLSSISSKREKAEALPGELAKRLKKRLVEAMGEGGLEGAIEVCHEAAMPLTADVSNGSPDWQVKRVSLRYRNPSNEPDTIDRQVLTDWQGSVDAGSKPQGIWIEASEGRPERYYQPIMIGGLCLQCHGPTEDIAPAIRQKLAEKYPNDQATGYQEGDLRGAFRVEAVRP